MIACTHMKLPTIWFLETKSSHSCNTIMLMGLGQDAGFDIDKTLYHVLWIMV